MASSTTTPSRTPVVALADTPLSAKPSAALGVSPPSPPEQPARATRSRSGTARRGRTGEQSPGRTSELWRGPRCRPLADRVLVLRLEGPPFGGRVVVEQAGDDGEPEVQGVLRVAERQEAACRRRDAGRLARLAGLL